MKTGRQRSRQAHALIAYSLVGVVFAAVCFSQSRPAQTLAASCQSVAVPAYSYPNPPTFWNGIINTHPPVSDIIANVNSGPGTSVDNNYTGVIGQAQTAGIKVLGYVWTNYGAQSTASVESDIDGWKNLYGVKNIMFDGTSSAAADESYYQTLANYVHANGGIVMLNPGTVPDEGYMQIGDIVNIFEGSATDYSSYTPPAWAKNYTSKIANVIFNVSGASAMQSVLTTSQKDDAGYVYITDDTLPNPYDTLPSYWSSETAQINQNCTPSAPPSSGSGGSSSSGGSVKKASGGGTTNTTPASAGGATTTTTTASPTAVADKTGSSSPAKTDSNHTAKTPASGHTGIATSFKWKPAGIVLCLIALGGLSLLIWRFIPLLAHHAGKHLRTGGGALTARR